MDRINRAKTLDLLTELAKSAECFYLSDLHDKSKAAAVTFAVDTIQSEQFSLEEWREAARYILQTDEAQGADVPDVIALLKSKLAGAE